MSEKLSSLKMEEWKGGRLSSPLGYDRIFRQHRRNFEISNYQVLCIGFKSNCTSWILRNYEKAWKYIQTSIGSNHASSKNYPTTHRRILGKILAVCDHKVEVIHSQTMNEIFQDKVISYVVGILWAAVGLLPNMWSAEMNIFAFGHT
jgi:hypothetical protein